MTTGAELKERGMRRAAANPQRAPYLEVAREAALASIKVLSLDVPEVSMNEVWLTLLVWGFDIEEFSNLIGPGAPGSVFRDGNWDCTGRAVKQTVNPRSHNRLVLVWRLK